MDISIRQNTNVFGAGGVIDEPCIAGIIKKRKGIGVRAGRENYKKIWEDEKEVRLKLMIKNVDYDETSSYFPKIAVPLDEEAFDIIKIRFGPKFVGKDEFMKKLERLEPGSFIEEVYIV